MRNWDPLRVIAPAPIVSYMTMTRGGIYIIERDADSKMSSHGRLFDGIDL